MVLEIENKRDMEDKQEESYKEKRKNYANSNYTTIKFFNETDLVKVNEQKDVQARYDFFQRISES